MIDWLPNWQISRLDPNKRVGEQKGGKETGENARMTGTTGSSLLLGERWDREKGRVWTK